MPSVTVTSATSASPGPSASGSPAGDTGGTSFQSMLDEQTQAAQASQSSASSAKPTPASSGPQSARTGQSEQSDTPAPSAPDSTGRAVTADSAPSGKLKTDKTTNHDTPGQSASNADLGRVLTTPADASASVAALGAHLPVPNSSPSASSESTTSDAARVAVGSAAASGSAPGTDPTSLQPGAGIPFGVGSASDEAGPYETGAGAPDSLNKFDGAIGDGTSWSATLGASLSRVSNQLSLADSGASNSGTLGSAAPHATNWAGADAGLLATPAPNAALMSASTASTASASVAAPVGSDQFASETAAKILYFAQNNIQSAQLSLNPAHLGPLDVQIRMSGEQVNLALSSAHADTRHALEAGLPKLREMFSEQGIQIGDVSVGARAFSQGSGSQYPSNSSNPGQTNPGSNGAAGGDPDAAPSAVRATVRSLQLVDTFA